MMKYEIILYWSERDDVYIAEVPELPGCMAHGNSHFEALKHVKSAIDLWLATARERQLAIPQPKGHKLMYA